MLVFAPVTNFNPRSPYGERPGPQWRSEQLKDFNPRSPYGERPGITSHKMWDNNFNPRSPYGERRYFLVKK